MKKSKALILSLICTPIVTVMILFMTVFGYAYFKVSSEKNFNTNVNVDLLFHRYETTVLGNYQDALLAEKKVDDPDATNPWENPDDAPWGTEYNPFVITNPYHLQNLSRLTASGYFENFFYKNYPANSTGDDVIISAKENIPHFVVSDQNGFITVLDASDYYISPVGSAERPFIGSFRGAVVKEGAPASVTIKKQLGDGTEETYTSATSAIYNLDIETHYDVVDIGLFGYVGYTLDSVTVETDETGTKYTPNPAKVSVLKDILIVDQKITSTLSVVDLSTWFDIAVEFYDELSTEVENSSQIKHYFNYPGSYDSENSVMSGELAVDGVKTLHKDTHHIGVLAGHIEYTTVENISVFYTANNICAIDIRAAGGNANYYSRTGIFGTVRNMNAKIEYKPEGGGSYIIEDEGLSDELISAGGGMGTGGGLASGSGQGYVTAAELYAGYSYTKQGTDYKYKDQYGDLDLWRYKLNDDSVNFETAVPVYAYPKSGGGYNYFLDEKQTRPATISGNTLSSTITNADSSTTTRTWTKFIVGYATASTAEGSIEYDYTFYVGSDTTTPIKYCNELTMFIREGVDKDGNLLCEEYESDAWISWITVDDLYYFYDGVFTFVLSDKEDTLEDTWENGNVDKIVLGTNDDSKWDVVESGENKSMVAFLKSVGNNIELNKAISDGKQIFILAKTGKSTETTEEVLLLSITLGSTEIGGSDDKTDNRYLMQGVLLNFDANEAERLEENYKNNRITTIPTTPSGGAMVESLDILKTDEFWDTGDYKVLNIGTASADVGIEEIKKNYNIKSDTVKENNNIVYYYYYENGAPATEGVSIAPSIKDAYSWEGYFYYVVERRVEVLWEVNYYTYYYQTADGRIINISNGAQRERTPSYYFTTNSLRANETNIYDRNNPYGKEQQYTVNGYTGVVINMTNMKFYSHNSTGEGSSASVSGTLVSKTSNTSVNFIFEDIDGFYYYFNGNNKIQVSTPVYTNSNTQDGGKKIYSATIEGTSQSYSGILLKRYPSYTFSNVSSTPTNTSYMQIINHEGWHNGIFSDWNYGSFYSLWAGKDGDRNASNTSIIDNSYNKNGVPVFAGSTDDPYCYIKYSLGSAVRYLNFNQTSFTGASTNASASTKLYIYTVEGMLDVNYGRANFEPAENKQEFYADSYVLMPQSGLTGTLGNKATDVKYNLVSVEDLADDGWVSRTGGRLTSAVLHKKFQMTKATALDFNFGINGVIELGNAPKLKVGTKGTLTTVPMGCVAFKIEALKKDETQTIRVIVAVPTSELHPKEAGFGLTYNTDYYFGLWSINESAENYNAGYLNRESPIEYFELPRSHAFSPYATGANNTQSGVTDQEYVVVNYDDKEYRSYLNGERVLVAYEFEVASTGVYVLGSPNSAMEIVYFAAGGTADAGYDGLASGQLGSIDFVYANNANKIITVDMTEPADVAVNTMNDPQQYYYASGCVLSINNMAAEASTSTEFTRADDLKLYVYRKIHQATAVDTATNATYNYYARYIYARVTSTSATKMYHGAFTRQFSRGGDNPLTVDTSNKWSYTATAFTVLPQREQAAVDKQYSATTD